MPPLGWRKSKDGKQAKSQRLNEAVTAAAAANNGVVPQELAEAAAAAAAAAAGLKIQTTKSASAAAAASARKAAKAKAQAQAQAKAPVSAPAPELPLLPSRPQDDAEMELRKRAEEFALKKRRGLFTEDLRRIMYGYGDDADPLKETVNIVEDIVIEYISEMTQKAMEQGGEGHKGKVHVNDLLSLVRRHPRKYARATELLRVDREIKKAREEHQQAKR